MGRSISVESRVFRSLAVAAIGFSGAACGRWQKKLTEATATPEPARQTLPCSEAEIYPEDDGFPLEASYLLERPLLKGGCAVRIFLDGYQDVYLIVYWNKLEFMAFDDMAGINDVYLTTKTPTKDQPVEFVFKQTRGRISQTAEGNFLVEYRVEK